MNTTYTHDEVKAIIKFVLEEERLLDLAEQVQPMPDPKKIERINRVHLQGISFRLEDMGGHYGNTARAGHS